MATFRLQPVLKLRRHEEDRRKYDLAGALAVENQHKDAAMRYARMRQRQVGEFRTRQQTGELNIAVLIEQRAYIGLLDREIRGQLQHAARAEHRTAGCRRRLAEAMVARKALEVLRDRASEADRVQQARADTIELDEVAVRMHGTAVRLEA